MKENWLYKDTYEMSSILGMRPSNLVELLAVPKKLISYTLTYFSSVRAYKVIYPFLMDLLNMTFLIAGPETLYSCKVRVRT